MIKDVLARDGRFGVVLIKSGLEALGPLAQPYGIGCLAHITRVDPMLGGRMNLTATTGDRFKILSLSNDRPYLMGAVENFPLETSLVPDDESKASLLKDKIRVYLKLIAEVNSSSGGDSGLLEITQLDLPKYSDSFLFMACALLQIPAVEKQTILEFPRAIEILSCLLRLFDREISVNRALRNVSEDEARNSAWLN